jgi:hypothetical protein
MLRFVQEMVLPLRGREGKIWNHGDGRKCEDFEPQRTQRSQREMRIQGDKT